MDQPHILLTSKESFSGTISFGESVRRLIHAGVESYHVDYAALRQTLYGDDGDVIAVPMPFENVPPVNATFSVEALKTAILDSQLNGQTFEHFSIRAIEAGVLGYMAFFEGKRVVYWGRGGDLHTEWFPGEGPKI